MKKERQKDSLNKMDKILLLLFITTVLFTASMVFLYYYHQSVPEPLIYSFFAALFGEISICGIVKSNNEKNKENGAFASESEVNDEHN